MPHKVRECPTVTTSESGNIGTLSSRFRWSCAMFYVVINIRGYKSETQHEPGYLQSKTL